LSISWGGKLIDKFPKNTNDLKNKFRMSDNKAVTPPKRNYAEEIEALKKEGATNTFVEKLIVDTEKKVKTDIEKKLSETFWFGFIIGAIVALVFVLFFRGFK
jgi:hypothetical protein